MTRIRTTMPGMYIGCLLRSLSGRAPWLDGAVGGTTTESTEEIRGRDRDAGSDAAEHHRRTHAERHQPHGSQCPTACATTPWAERPIFVPNVT
jgi:hypothetical protein